MKKIVSVALAAQMLLLVPHVASAGGHHRRGGGSGNLGSFIGGLIVGGVAGFLISNLTRGDRVLINNHADACLDGYSRGACDRDVYLRDQRANVRIVPHQRVYFVGQPNECRAYHVVHNGRVVDTRYRCLDGRRWVEPRAQWGQPRYFDRPYHDPRMRRWDYNQAPAAPVMVAPQPRPPRMNGVPPAQLPPTGGVVRTQPAGPNFQPGRPAPDILPPLQQPRAIR